MLWRWDTRGEWVGNMLVVQIFHHFCLATCSLTRQVLNGIKDDAVKNKWEATRLNYFKKLLHFMVGRYGHHSHHPQPRPPLPSCTQCLIGVLQAWPRICAYVRRPRLRVQPCWGEVVLDETGLT